MMSNTKVVDASGKAPLGGGVFTEIVMTLLDPWTIRFEDEATQHTKITGGTTLATDAVGAARNVTTNPALTVNQSISGTLVETGVSGLTATEAAQLALLDGIEGSYDHQEVMRLILAALAGKLTGAGTSTVTIRDTTDSKDRIVATVDSNGNRSAVTLDAS